MTPSCTGSEFKFWPKLFHRRSPMFMARFCACVQPVSPASNKSVSDSPRPNTSASCHTTTSMYGLNRSEILKLKLTLNLNIEANLTHPSHCPQRPILYYTHTIDNIGIGKVMQQLTDWETTQNEARDALRTDIFAQVRGRHVLC